MIYSDFFLTSASDDLTLIDRAYNKNFDFQSGFKTSTVKFSLPTQDAKALGISEGKYIRVSVDDYLAPISFVLESSNYDYATVDDVSVTEFAGRSIHALGEDDVILPSAWPNPVPSGHAFQNATVGTIIKTLVTRSQDRGKILDWKHATFSGNTDSKGKVWPSVVDRNFTNGDSVYAALNSLVEDGLVELDFDGFNLKAYVPGTLGKTIPQDTMFLRPGYTLSEGSAETDYSDFATDIFAIGEGSAVAYETRPELYSVVGRRKTKFVQYGGISNVDLLKVLAKADLDRYGVVKIEDSVKLPHEIYQPFTTFGLNDWVSVDRGDGTGTLVQVKQISFQQSSDSWTVGVSLGTLLDSLEEKIQRRLDAITGANAGGGAVPNDKASIKIAPAAPTNLTTTVQPYLDNQQRRKVIALADWSDVITYSNGTPLKDVDNYEVAVKAGNTTDYGAAQSVDFSSAVFSGYDPDTKFQYRVRAFVAGLASPWVESPVVTLVDNTPLVLSEPTAPILTTRGQSVNIAWDGKVKGGTAPSRDCHGVEVHLSAIPNFTPSTSTWVAFIPYTQGSQVGGSFTVANLDPKMTYYARFVPLGNKGTAGTASAISSATTTDLAVTPEQINSINTDLNKAKSDLYNPGGTVDTIKTTLTGQITAGDNMVLSKGTDLVVNGTAYLGNNTNFSSLTYTSDGPVGTSGAFIAASNSMVIWSDQAIPVSMDKRYILSMQARELTSQGNAQMYAGLGCFDSSGLPMQPHMYAYKPSAETTLVAPLQKGDTVVKLADVSNWTLLNGYVTAWNYTDAKGKTWPAKTYSRWNAAIKSIDTANNTVTLVSGWPYGSLQTGAPIGNTFAGDNYLYCITGATNAKQDWTTYTSSIVGGVHDGATGAAATTKFPQGTTAVKILILANRAPSSGAQTAFAGFSMSDATAAQVSADAAAAAATTAKTAADNAANAAANAAGIAGSKSDVLFQTTAPSASMQKSSTLWVDTSNNLNAPKRWDGSNWVVVTDKAATDAASAAAAAQATANTAKTNAAAAQATADRKITTYSQNTAPTAPTGGFTVGDIWINSSDKNHSYRWSGSAWVDARDGAISDASNTAAKAVSDAAAALSAAQQAQATADGAISTYYQETPPWADGSSQPSTKLGDLWYKSSTNQAYRWDGSKWALISDTQITAALNAAQQAQVTADGKIDAFYQGTQPVAASIGDLWFDTANQNKAYYCSATNPVKWTLVADGRIADAQKAAADAQALADKANTAAATAAGVAGSKADVLMQTSAPDVSMQKPNTLWIDTTGGANTPKRWDGSAWATITDKAAIDAAAAAVAAKNAADAAQKTADTAQKDASTARSSADWAQFTANGKNSTFWGQSAPSDTDNPGKAWGDVWYQYAIDSKGNFSILGTWTWYNTWKTSVLTETYLPAVNIGTGTYGNLEGARLKAKSVQADAILVDGSVGSTVIADGAITTSKLVAEAITGDKIKANTITTANIAARTITGDNLNVTSVVTSLVDTLQVKAANILTGDLKATVGISSTGAIIAGDVKGAHAELTSSGFRAYTAPVDESGTPVPSVQLGTGGDDVLTITNSNGDENASIAPTGDATFASVTTPGDASVLGSDLLGSFGRFDSPGESWFDKIPWGVIAFGDARPKISGLSNVSGFNPFMKIGFTINPNRMYRFTLPFRYDVTGVPAGGVGRVAIATHYTWSTGTSEPDEPTTSTGLFRDVVADHTANVDGVSNTLSFVWNPAEYGGSDSVKIKILFSLFAGNCQVTPSTYGAFGWAVTVEDIGPKLDDTGDIVITPTAGTPPAPAKKTYTSTWTASDSWTFYGNGSRDTYGKDKGVTRAGYWNSTSGDMKTMCVFNNNATSGEAKTIASALSGGAVLKKAEVFVQTVHWYDTTGGPMLIRQAKGSSIPTTLSDSTARSGGSVQKNFTTRNQGFWVTVPTSWFSASNRAIYFGPAGGSTWLHTYCHVASHTNSNTNYRPKVRLTYTR